MTQLELTAFAHNARHVGRGLLTPSEGNSPLTGLSYPSAPGFKEKGGTSEAAARAIAERSGLLRNRCLEALRKKNITSDELADALGESVSTVRARVSELSRQHKVFRSKDRRKNSSGINVIVWTASPEEAVADALACKCLEALRKQEMTASELVIALGEKDWNVRDRVRRLYAQQKIFKSRRPHKKAGGHIWTTNPAAETDRSVLLEGRCLAALREREMTSEELAVCLGESLLNVKPRLSKLFSQHQVFKTEVRRKNASGHRGVVWAVAAPLATRQAAALMPVISGGPAE